MKLKHYVYLFICLLPVFLWRDFTPDNELRYLSIANENLALGRFFAFLHHGEIYADKPPLYLWIVMACRWVLGTHSMLVLSLFSILPAFGIIAIMDRWTATTMNQAGRFATGILLFTSAFFVGSAIVLRMDMLMCFFITLAIWTFYRNYQGQIKHAKAQWLFGLHVFLALFSKGPMGLIIPILAPIIFLILNGELRRIPKFLSWRVWIVLLSFSTVWFTMVWREGGSEYLNNLLFHQTVNRAVDSFHHKKPFYYYGIAIWYAVAPWSLLLLEGLRVKNKKQQHPVTSKVFLTTFLLTLLFLSFVSSKIVIYLLPGFAFLIYYLVPRINPNEMSLMGRIGILFVSLLFTLLLPVAAAVLLLEVDLPIVQPIHLIALLPISASGVWSFRLFARKASLYRLIPTLGFGLLMTVGVAGFFLPSINSYIGYGEMCRIAKELQATHHTEGFYSYEVRRPENMDVYLEESIYPTSRVDIIQGAHANSILLISNKKSKDDVSLQEYIKHLQRVVVGDHTIVVLK